MYYTSARSNTWQIQLKYWFDRNLFDQKKLKAKTKVKRTDLLELQYADDCVMVADSLDSLQHVLSLTSAFYPKLGLSINVSKTEFIEYLPTTQQNPKRAANLWQPLKTSGHL